MALLFGLVELQKNLGRKHADRNISFEFSGEHPLFQDDFEIPRFGLNRQGFSRGTCHRRIGSQQAEIVWRRSHPSPEHASAYETGKSRRREDSQGLFEEKTSLQQCIPPFVLSRLVLAQAESVRVYPYKSSFGASSVSGTDRIYQVYKLRRSSGDPRTIFSLLRRRAYLLNPMLIHIRSFPEGSGQS